MESSRREAIRALVLEVVGQRSGHCSNRHFDVWQFWSPCAGMELILDELQVVPQDAQAGPTQIQMQVDWSSCVSLQGQKYAEVFHVLHWARRTPLSPTWNVYCLEYPDQTHSFVSHDARRRVTHLTTASTSHHFWLDSPASRTPAPSYFPLLIFLLGNELRILSSASQMQKSPLWQSQHSWHGWLQGGHVYLVCIVVSMINYTV